MPLSRELELGRALDTLYWSRRGADTDEAATCCLLLESGGGDELLLEAGGGDCLELEDCP